MELNFRKFGEGPPLIIVHGLYGESDNWVSIGKELSDLYEVYLIDQRNHGSSPHTPGHSYKLMKNDLLEFMDQQGIGKAILMGHSMGGKTIMFFAADYPERVQSMIVVDISPRSYKSTDQPSPHTLDHLNVLNAMMDVDFNKAESRMDIDMMLASTITSRRVRQFLLKNVRRKDRDHFEWKINLQALHDAMPDILDGLDPAKYRNGNGITGFPVLFIRGENSDYIMEADLDIIHTIFPTAEIVTIPNTGHWVHAEKPELFLKNVRYFLEGN